DPEAGRRLLVRIDVQLRDRHTALVFLGELLDDRRDHAARPAPCGPEVHDRETRRLFDQLLEVAVRSRLDLPVLGHPLLLMCSAGRSPAARQVLAYRMPDPQESGRPWDRTSERRGPGARLATRPGVEPFPSPPPGNR